MLRYKTETRPGLVALYDIRPGNGAGQFLHNTKEWGQTNKSKSTNEQAKYKQTKQTQLLLHFRIQPQTKLKESMHICVRQLSDCQLHAEQ